MEIINLTYPHSYEQDDFPKIAAAIGFFDGIHKGHQKVIKEAVSYAEAKNIKSAVITFTPHPSVVLSKDKKITDYITPKKEKIRILKQLKIDYLFIVHFNERLSKLSPETFLNHFIEKLHIVFLTAGFDFTFGKRGVANMYNIDEYLSKPIETKIVEQVSLDEEKISSTKIRKLLSEGKVNEVKSLLGRPLRIVGKVIHGKKRGRTIGFPTANLELVEKDALLPKQGVYAVSVQINEHIYFGIANLGYNPTFENEFDKLKFEVYLLNFDREIYGEKLYVYFYKHIRNEQKFNSVDELIEQIERDVQFTKKYFNKI